MTDLRHIRFFKPRELSGENKIQLADAGIPEGFVLYGKGPMSDNYYDVYGRTTDVRFLERYATGSGVKSYWSKASTNIECSGDVYCVRIGSPIYYEVLQYLDQELQGKEVFHDF